MSGALLMFYMGFIFGGLAGMFCSALCIASARADRKDDHK